MKASKTFLSRPKANVSTSTSLSVTYNSPTDPLGFSSSPPAHDPYNKRLTFAPTRHRAGRPLILLDASNCAHCILNFMGVDLFAATNDEPINAP